MNWSQEATQPQGAREQKALREHLPWLSYISVVGTAVVISSQKVSLSALASLWEVCLGSSMAQVAGGLLRWIWPRGRELVSTRLSTRAPPKEPTIQGRALALRGKLEDKSITHLHLLFAKCR